MAAQRSRARRKMLDGLHEDTDDFTIRLCCFVSQRISSCSLSIESTACLNTIHEHNDARWWMW